MPSDSKTVGPAGSSPSIRIGASVVAQAEQLYSQARTAEVIECLGKISQSELDLESAVRLSAVEGMALFERGDVVSSVAVLKEAVEYAGQASKEIQFQAALFLFSRESQFQAPEEALPSLARLRQLASVIGQPSSIGSLHLVVSRLEAFRGHCVNARRHVELSRELLGRTNRPTDRAALSMVDAGLEMYAGNLNRAMQFARAGVETARSAGLQVFLAGSLTNLGLISALAGLSKRARSYLRHAV